ncbi:hypothetical protein ACFOKI_07240 [Sphingomonas qilianensis]|uniref:Uncharacterized protein n=1 Tax=Sphingomonas qilianensis TaxID=1736690 RepID=A0ABU9XTW0_9SPHN
MTRPIPVIFNPPFNPIHEGLYIPEELLVGYDLADPASVVRTLDYRCFIYFEQQGRTTVADPYAGMMQAVHDASVARGMNTFLATHLANGRRPVSIMGGHREVRGSSTYRAVAKIAKLLSEHGFLVASGGGPGCMEATHLGALFANADDAEMATAIDRLAAEQAALPKGMDEVLTQDDKSKQWVIDEEKAVGLAKWMEPARLIANERRSLLKIENESLAVPTWHYGHEPFTPLATHVAKYFLNSIREDVLLALASSGIIYSEGRAGTLQEVFQDTAQNYYRKKNIPITSMVFYDTKFWSSPADPVAENPPKVHLPVCDLLYRLFVDGEKMTKLEFDQFIRFTDDPGEVVKIIIDNTPPLENVVQALVGVGMKDFSAEQVAAASVKAMAFTGN